MGGPTMRALLTQGVLGEGDALIYFAWMRGIFAGKNADIASWKVGKFLEKLARDYGYNHNVLPLHKVRLATLRRGARQEQIQMGRELAEESVLKYCPTNLRSIKFRTRHTAGRRKRAGGQRRSRKRHS
jgi:hypothetical protein